MISADNFSQPTPDPEPHLPTPSSLDAPTSASPPLYPSTPLCVTWPPWNLRWYHLYQRPYMLPNTPLTRKHYSSLWYPVSTHVMSPSQLSPGGFWHSVRLVQSFLNFHLPGLQHGGILLTHITSNQKEDHTIYTMRSGSPCMTSLILFRKIHSQSHHTIISYNNWR